MKEMRTIINTFKHTGKLIPIINISKNTVQKYLFNICHICSNINNNELLEEVFRIYPDLILTMPYSVSDAFYLFSHKEEIKKKITNDIVEFSEREQKFLCETLYEMEDRYILDFIGKIKFPYFSYYCIRVSTNPLRWYEFFIEKLKCHPNVKYYIKWSLYHYEKDNIRALFGTFQNILLSAGLMDKEINREMKLFITNEGCTCLYAHDQDRIDRKISIS
jgi:hypothetical protein